jgi:hypothetical protein
MHVMFPTHLVFLYLVTTGEGPLDEDCKLYIYYTYELN